MKETNFYFALIIVAAILVTEVVACEWHADNLSKGCDSNPIACAAQRDHK